MTIEKRNLINTILALIIISAIGGLGYYFFGGEKSYVPVGFIDAREQSSELASQLVSDLSLSLDNLNKIESADRNSKFALASDLVNKEIFKIEAIKNKALDLSVQLTNMAQAVQGIKPVEARALALEAVSQGVTLIGHLNNYNVFLSSLLETLKLKFSGDIRYDNQTVQGLINNMNSEKDIINGITQTLNLNLQNFDQAL